ncbi:hypothetical protein GW17_00008547 [Ensete ventricosum]|nr:hypothetical protein GW17_00008547 [Ensete ventricosum]RZR81906.1 hypothetical protein BHM03_00008213 [Ensete ventricosum]
MASTSARRRHPSYSLCCFVLSTESTCKGHRLLSLGALQRGHNKFFLAVKRQQIYDRSASLVALQIRRPPSSSPPLLAKLPWLPALATATTSLASPLPLTTIVHLLRRSVRRRCYPLPQSLPVVPSVTATVVATQPHHCPLLQPSSSHSKGHSPSTPLLRSCSRRSTPSKPQSLVDSFKASAVSRLLLRSRNRRSTPSKPQPPIESSFEASAVFVGLADRVGTFGIRLVAAPSGLTTARLNFGFVSASWAPELLAYPSSLPLTVAKVNYRHTFTVVDNIAVSFL